MIDNCSTILLKAAEKEMTDSWKGQMVKYLRFHFNLLSVYCQTSVNCEALYTKYRNVKLLHALNRIIVSIFSLYWSLDTLSVKL